MLPGFQLGAGLGEETTSRTLIKIKLLRAFTIQTLLSALSRVKVVLARPARNELAVFGYFNSLGKTFVCFHISRVKLAYYFVALRNLSLTLRQSKAHVKFLVRLVLHPISRD